MYIYYSFSIFVFFSDKNYKEELCRHTIENLIKCCSKYEPGQSVCCSGYIKEVQRYKESQLQKLNKTAD